MRVLLDTNAFIWALENSPRLSIAAAAAIDGPGAQPLLSIASIWEIAIKCSIGKLRGPVPLEPALLQKIQQQGIALLPIRPEHALAVRHLPFHHRDPFDRLLIVQGLAEGLPIVSIDAAFDRYGVRRIW